MTMVQLTAAGDVKTCENHLDHVIHAGKLIASDKEQ